MGKHAARLPVSCCNVGVPLLVQAGRASVLTLLCISLPLSVRLSGSGLCRFSYSDPDIVISFSLNSSDDWITLERIRSVSFPPWLESHDLLLLLILSSLLHIEFHPPVPPSVTDTFYV